MEFPNKQKLLDIAGSLPEETLRVGLEIIQSIPVSEMDDLLYSYYQEGNQGVKNFFMRKAVKEIEQRTVDLPP